ncbi:MAG: hypothetical protein ACOYYS_13015, partial [Chloroflexota bacterium]
FSQNLAVLAEPCGSRRTLRFSQNLAVLAEPCGSRRTLRFSQNLAVLAEKPRITSGFRAVPFDAG